MHGVLLTVQIKVCIPCVPELNGRLFYTPHKLQALLYKLSVGPL